MYSYLMPRSRKITIVVLIILTLVLAGISVYIAIRLNQQDQAPDDTSAQIQCPYPGTTLSLGASCNTACGPNACDGPGGPLGCNPCPSGTVNEGQYRCYNGDSSNPNVVADAIVACGGNAASSCTGTAHCSNGSQDCGETGLDCGGDCSACSGTGGSLQCPNGTGAAGGCLIFLCPNGCGTDNRCQGDDVGVQIFAENGSCSATLDGRCGQIDIMQGSNISVSNPGSFCGVKVDAVSGEQITCGLPVCNPVVTAQCNQACTGTGQGNCASGLQCINNVCRNPAVPNDADCTPDPGIPVCNEACTGTGQGNCASGLQCISGVCRNPSIPNDSDCAVDPVCGSACGSNGACPVGNVCDTSRNICVLTQCLNNANCTNNGCTLPATALFSEGGDNKLLIGVFLIILGLLATQFKFDAALLKFTEVQEKLGLKFENKVGKNIESKINNVSETKNKRVKKSRKKFEKKF